MNRRAMAPLRVDAKLPAHLTFNRSFMLVKPSPRPAHGPWRVEAGARSP